MSDRELTLEELNRFVNEGLKRKIGFNALETFAKEKVKPTLHDLCIDELHAIIVGQRTILIDQGRKINSLEDRIKILEKRAR